MSQLEDEGETSSTANNEETALLGTSTEPNPTSFPPASVRSEESVEQTWWELIKECWNPYTVYKDMFIRERGEDLYPLDAVRAFAYLWVCGYHIYEGLENYYSTISFGKAFGSWADLLIYAGVDGVVLFFVLSGFLIPYIFVSISRKNKDGNALSLKSVVTFLVRRYLRIAPSISFATLVVYLYGCYNPNGDNSLASDYCSDCATHWYDNFIFTANYSGASCWPSTWTLSNEMQFYLLSIPIVWAYVANKWFGIFVTGCLMFSVWYYRESLDDDMSYLSQKIYERADEYCVGILLYFFWEEFGRFKAVSAKVAATSNAFFQRIKILPCEDLSGTGNPTTSLLSCELIKEEVKTNWLHDIIRFTLIGVSIYSIYDSAHLLYNDNTVDYLVLATATGALMYLVLEKSLYPIRWVMSWYIWFPLASVSYNGYLYSMLTAYMYSDILIYVNKDRDTKSWDGTAWDWFLVYLSCLSLNLVFAVVAGFLIERPFMHLSKKIKFDWINI